MTITSDRFTAAFARTIAESKRAPAVIVTEVARRFVGRVIAITPPARGHADVAAKKSGEQAFIDDIRRVARPAPAGYIAALRRDWGGDTWQPNGPPMAGDIYTRILTGSDALKTWHDGRKSPVTGRTPFGNVTGLDADLGKGRTRGRREKAEALIKQAARKGVDPATRAQLNLAVVDSAAFNAYVKEQKGRVGWLAAGWNKAAAKLGTAVPAWIKRHRSGAGDIKIDATATSFRIIVENAVTYGSHVKGFVRSVATALDQQAGAMEKRSAEFLAKSIARNGLA